VHGQKERKVKVGYHEIREKDRGTWAGGREREKRGWKERKKSTGNYWQRKDRERKRMEGERKERIGEHEQE
jgi:hypothetical protein